MKKLLASLIILTILVLSIIIIFNNKHDKPVAQNGKLTIVTSLYPIYDFTKELVGNKANVYMLLSPGVEIHDYEPTPQDIIRIQESDLFLYTGEELEPWAKTVISGLDNPSNIRVISQNVELLEHEEHEGEHHDEHGKFDTHIWLDPLRVTIIVDNITNQLCQIDPENEDFYRNNALEYTRKLVELDNSFELATKGKENKEIAFGGPFAYSYFLNRYNIKYVSAYDSCGENSEPSIEKITSVITEMENKKIPVIFYKELSSGKIADTISAETGAKKLEFNSLHSVSQKDLDNGETYLSLMYKNLENLKQALE